ncbi:MAG: phosphoribosylaminoimidazolesuccinocarboxamide synthase [Hydrogenobaculum sp.]
MNKLYEGKAKIVYENDEDTYIIKFKDDVTAFDAIKKDNISGKGHINLEITSFIFELLKAKNIKTHFIKKLSEDSMLVLKAKRLDVEVVVRNIAAGSLSKRLGIKEGTPLNPPLVELFYKSDELHDPLICIEHVKLLNLATEEDIAYMKQTALKVNDILKEFFDQLDIILVDFKLEFGKTKDGEIILIDEISPDSCRLWDKKTGEKLDKDRFRFDLGDLKEGYLKILERIKANL